MNINELYSKYKKPLKEYAIKIAVPFLLNALKSGLKAVINKLGQKKTGDTISVPTKPPETTVEAPRTIVWKPSPNYSSRKGGIIDAIVLHHTGPGGLKATVSWFESPTSNVSAHYVIDRNGDILQMVDDIHRAFHCGVSELHGIKDVNNFSIGIELVGDGIEEFTQEQYEVVAWLCKTLKTKYNISDKRIVGHRDVAIPVGRKTDPTPFDFEKFKTLMN